MANEEEQLRITAVELRKFRKKLRQIERLEELERDLTEEEIFKLSTKDELRSKVQELIARADVLTREKQNMETEPVEEPANEQEEERMTENSQAVVVDNPGSSHYAPSEIREQNREEPVTNEAYDQAPLLRPLPAVTAPDVVLEAQTRATSVLASDSTTMRFHVRNFEGHNDVICSVDCQGSLLVSGGRDTMLKLWDADSGRETRSMGGHTGTITSVFLVPKEKTRESAPPSGFRADQYSVLTGSKDCSMKIWSLANGQITRSMYVFSPVESLDCNCNNVIAAGLDGGKVELWDLETGTSVRSVRGHDEDAVTALKFQDSRVVSGSASGVVKVWDVRDNSLKSVMSSEHACADNAAGNVAVKPRRVRCIATTQEAVYWGDDGVNMKAMDLKTGKLRKIRNHVTEFGSTGAMATTGTCLVSAGYDLDRGNGYLNVRRLPSEEYVATVDDENTGCITCLSCTETTRDKVTLHRMCTGGMELKVWDQLPRSKVKKRARPETDDVYITAKHVRRYGLPDVSDTESSEEDDDQPEGGDSDDDDDVSNAGSTSRSWCTIS
ncbi:uncharacterized protein [Montipora capricornis]|uniref:uncharacterized protein isoform X1 n=1 Tax=Montipora capricornis TaxID=246305 RepID=UPI0035F19037